MKRTVLALSVLAMVAALPLAARSQRRGAAPGRFSVTIGGVSTAVRSVEGGEAYSDVVTEKLGPDHITHKHLAGVRYEDIVISANMGALSSLIASTTNHRHTRFDGSFEETDADGTVRRRIDFFHAIVREVSFPALDASSREPAYVQITLAPEVTRRGAIGGRSTVSLSRNEAKVFQPSNFRLAVDGLDTSRVNKVEGITLKQKVVEHVVGEMRDYQNEGAGSEVPNLRLTVSDATARTWQDWFDDFVVRGNNEAEHEKVLTISYLDGSNQALVELRATGVGIFSMRRDSADGGTPGYDVGLYLEDVQPVGRHD
jgi:hypothetical protein